MDRLKGEPFWFDCPLFADELVGREAIEGLQPSPEAVGADEVGEVISQRLVVVVVKAFDGCVLDRAVHPFKLRTVQKLWCCFCLILLRQAIAGRAWSVILIRFSVRILCLHCQGKDFSEVS